MLVVHSFMLQLSLVIVLHVSSKMQLNKQLSLLGHF